MTNTEIQQLAEYAQDLMEGLHEWDYDQLAMQTEYPKVYEAIEQLMQATFEAKDKQIKTKLALLEMKLRKCKDCIERRLKVWN